METEREDRVVRGGAGGGREEKGGSVTRMWLINRMWCMRVCDTGPVTCQAVAHE